MQFKLFENGTPSKTSNLAAKALVLDDALARDKAVGVISGNAPPPPVTPPPPVPADIATDSALGRVRATAAVAKRLEVAPSVEFINIARQTKERFFLGGLQLLAGAGYALEDIAVTGFEIDETPAAATGAPPPALVRKPIEDAADLLALYAANSAVKIVDDDDDPNLKTEEQTEGRFFAFGLNAIDSTVRFLRSIETRTDDYRRLQTDARAARERLQSAVGRLATEIASVETRLAEVRHDLSVARSLRAEEVQRVAQLVERRKAILAEHVPYLVFRRPLVTRVLENSPVIPAEPALIDDPVPAARQQTDELLPELQQMVDSLRDVPARWFRKAVPLFLKFDRVQSIERLATTAFERINVLAGNQGRAIAFEPDGSKAAQQLRRTFDGQEQRVLKLAQDAQSQLAAAQGSSAKGALEIVRQFASVSDLLRAAPPTRDVSLGAAGLLDDIGNVAQSLYELFSEVPPAARLRWAELFSELDPSVPLRQLTVLPEFGNEAIGVDFIQWRQMQKLVDWLFLQVEADENAVAAINDLVRVCLLLSAHAPVKRILSARVKRPVPAVVDTRIELELDPRVARIGMQVLVHAPLTNVVIARAVVEDMASGGGVARVTQVMGTQQTIDTSARVQLQAGPPLSTPAAAEADKSRSDAQRTQAQAAQEARQDALAQRTQRGVGMKAGRTML
jgi:hypothetical protein